MFTGVYDTEYGLDQQARRTQMQPPFQRSLYTEQYNCIDGQQMKHGVPHPVPSERSRSSYSERTTAASFDPRYFDAGDHVPIDNLQYVNDAGLKGFNKNEVKPYTYHVPGYSGHVPGRREQHSKTYSDDTRHCLKYSAAGGSFWQGQQQ